MIFIIRVNKEEAAEIRRLYPETQLVRTCVQKSNQHTYYAVESRGVVNLVKRMREGSYEK